MHTRLSILYDVYGHRFPLQPALRKQIDDMLSQLSLAIGVGNLQPMSVSEVSLKPVKQLGLRLPVISQKSGEVLTQTQAYLSMASTRLLADRLIKKLEKEYGIEHVAQYLGIIPNLIRQELALKDHYVFYHGQRGDFVLLYEIIKEIEQWLAMSEKDTAFQHLRVPSMLPIQQSVTEFLKATVKEDVTGREKETFDLTYKGLSVAW